MSIADDVGRISVSRDALRAELASMELRLIEKLATQTELEVLRRATEVEIESVRHEVDKLRLWRAYTVGVTTVALGVGSTAFAIAIRTFV